MSYHALLARAVDEDVPFAALLELTVRCDLACSFCFNDRAKAGTPLSLAQYATLLADLADLSTVVLTLSGGEPLAHPDFFAVGARARQLGFVVRVKSNGHRLGELVARRLRDEVDPFVVEVSLHGASAATHDRQTRVAGSFDRLLGSLDAMRRAGLRVQLNATLTAWNEGELEEMAALAGRLGLLLRWNAQITPRDDGDPAPLALAASPGAVRRLGELLERSRPPAPAEADAAPSRPWTKVCGAASSGLAVDPWGNVYPCVQWRLPGGNLHRERIRDIWERSPAMRAVRARTRSLAAAAAATTANGDQRWVCPALGSCG